MKNKYYSDLDELKMSKIFAKRASIRARCLWINAEDEKERSDRYRKYQEARKNYLSLMNRVSMRECK